INKGDLADNNDDLCVHVDYATPTPNVTVPVRNAVAQQTVQDCHGVTLTKKRFEYYNLSAGAVDPAGQVTDGSVASSTVTRFDMDSHISLGDIKLFDATYNADGTLKSTTKTRDDGATISSTVDKYDPFGLVATNSTSSATALPDIHTSVTPHPVTLAITS